MVVIYIVPLDDTKALNMVQYCKLLHELVKRGMSISVIRLLLLYMFIYKEENYRSNGKYTFRPFSVKNGVKQGGVLLPISFSVYIDGLLARL